MSKRRITITEALVELSELKSRLEYLLNSDEVVFISLCQTNTGRTPHPYMDKKELSNSITNNFKEIESLFNKINTIELLIQKQNTDLVLEPNDLSLSVYELKQVIKQAKQKKILIDKIHDQIKYVKERIQLNEVEITEGVDTIMNTIMPSDEHKDISTPIKELIEASFRKKEGFEILDPNSIISKIDTLEKSNSGLLQSAELVLKEFNDTNFIIIDEY